MTKDWDLVQDEIKELSFTQKKPLGEVKELMERKYRFYASTRAYRMKLKEWGLMRQKQRSANKTRRRRRQRGKDVPVDDDDDDDDDDGYETEAVAMDSPSQEHITQNSDWRVVPSEPALVTDEPGEQAQPMFTGLVDQAQDVQIPMDTWSTESIQPSDIALDMVGAVLDNDCERLEKLVINNVDHVNDPLGSTLFEPTGRFFGHPALSQIVILQHPRQKLLDIVCAMPCGPMVWIVLAYGGKGSRHPLGSDLALHNAIKNGRKYTVQSLLQPGRSSVNGLPDSKWTPLRQAVFWMHPEIVLVLLSRGAAVEDTIPSSVNSPLQLCLVRRENNYTDPLTRTHCNQILKMLLNAGANIHITSPDPMLQLTFEAFIRPWMSRPYWAFEISQDELECFEMFVSQGTNIQLPFQGVPCRSPAKGTFVHQVLWHSTPAFARSLVDNFVPTANDNGMHLLLEVLGSCPDAKRHPADTLRDIQVLLAKGVSPNRPARGLICPLRKCIMDCPAVDLIARLQVLLDAGANPEAQDLDGMQPYVLAAETFDEPLLSEVMSILVAKIPGRHVHVVDGVSHQWAGGFFPISTTQTYQQVMSCSRLTGDFAVCMRDMVPEHVRAIFHKAYFAVASRYFFDTMTRLAKARTLSAQEKDEITQIVLMRKSAGIPAYKFEPELVVALLHMQPSSNITLDLDTVPSTGDEIYSSSSSSTEESPASTMTLEATTPTATSHAPFQFNPNGTATLDDLRPPPTSDHICGEFFVASTTKIRCLNPCAKAKPTTKQFAREYLLKHKCATCNDGKLLTKKELDKHQEEHEHSAQCSERLCTRRFCAAKKKSGTCHNHLFLGNI